MIKNYTKLLIVEDHYLMRKSIKMVLGSMDQKIHFDEASDGLQGISLVKEKFYDIVLLDIRLPKIMGVEVAKIIREEHPHTKILVYSDYDYKNDVISLMKLEVEGFLLKSESDDIVLAKTIDTVLNGRKYFSPDVMDEWYKYLSEEARHSPNNHTKELLTTRENQIVSYVCSEMTSEEIADKICVEVSTVKTHRNNIMKKLNVKSVIGLFIYALQNQLVDIATLEHVNKKKTAS